MNLVDSMKIEVICTKNELDQWLNIKLITYEEAVRRAFGKIEQQEVLSSWTDALSQDKLEGGVSNLLNVPKFGCLKDARQYQVEDTEYTLNRIWSVGGQNGWYYGNWLWKIRGYLDKLVGGVGLRRGRKNPTSLHAGETLDFWRIIYASRTDARLLLYAEMKLPGEAWLEFKIRDGVLHQTATFRPWGIFGRLYWFSLLPFHHFIFNGMLKQMALRQ